MHLTFHNVYVSQMITLYTLNILNVYSFICQLYLNQARKKEIEVILKKEHKTANSKVPSSHLLGLGLHYY